MLSFLLGTHPDIATIGERRKFYNKSIRPDRSLNQLCSCGQTFQDCEYWSEINRNLLARVEEKDLMLNATEYEFSKNKYWNKIATKMAVFTQLNAIPIDPFTDKIEHHGKINQILVEEVLKMGNSQVFLDSSKVMHHALFLSRIPAFDLYVIWLARDPRAQVSSALKYNKWTIEKAAHRWKNEMQTNERILKKANLHYLSLSYEKLCRKPEAEMTRILEFVDLDANKFSLDFREQTQHIMGNTSMRLGKDATIRERKDWQKRLTTEQISTIEKITKNYQEYYSN